MSSDWRLFIQPDNATRMNRSGSREAVIPEVTLSPAASSHVLDPPRISQINFLDTTRGIYSGNAWWSNQSRRARNTKGILELLTVYFQQDMVRMRGLEPPRDCSRSHLKAVRLPISPHPLDY